jgi:hypothetical protein
VEGAAPLIAVALIVPLLLGGAGVLVVRKRRILGVALLGATAVLLAAIAMFSLG